jgi:hypothetical protein
MQEDPQIFALDGSGRAGSNLGRRANQKIRLQSDIFHFLGNAVGAAECDLRVNATKVEKYLTVRRLRFFFFFFLRAPTFFRRLNRRLRTSFGPGSLDRGEVTV